MKPIHRMAAKRQGAAAQDEPGPAAFTTYYTWTANGVHPSVNFVNANVHANSKARISQHRIWRESAGPFHRRRPHGRV